MKRMGTIRLILLVACIALGLAVQVSRENTAMQGAAPGDRISPV